MSQPFKSSNEKIQDWGKELDQDGLDLNPVLLPLMETGAILLPYQSKSIELARKCKLLVIEKSRRIGLTWGLASEAVLCAASKRSAGGMKVWYMGYDLDMAREFIDTCAMWARAFNCAIQSFGEYVFEDKHGDVKAFRIKFASGFEIVSLPSVARSLRGKQGWFILDEAAFVGDLEEVLKAGKAFVIWAGKLTIISTHDGEGNAFNSLISDIKTPPKDGKKSLKGETLKITFDEAVDDGLYERVKLITPANDNEPFPNKEDWVAEIRGIYGDNASEELDCIPSVGGAAWIEDEDLRGAESNDAGIPEKYTGGRVVIGRDVARRRDYAVIWAFEIIEGVMWLREAWEGQNVSFKEQDKIFDAMMEKYNAMAAIDQTGMGEKVVEDLQLKWGEARVKGVLFSAPTKLNLATIYRNHFEAGTIRIVRDKLVRADHRSLKRASSKSKALAEGDVHPDRFWAGALAAWLVDQGLVEFGYQTLRATTANDDYDDDDIFENENRYAGGMTRHGMTRGGSFNG